MSKTAVVFGALLILVPLGAEAATLTYDALGRLRTFVSDNGKTTTYVYDAADNRTSVTTGALGARAVAAAATKPVGDQRTAAQAAIAAQREREQRLYPD